MIGQTISHYRITEKLGAGGMGEVYRAEDTNLDRQVAIKVLPDIFSGNPERLARFEREAKLLASLNHPNIAAIHGLEEAAGKRFLVLELVEGETLAQRIAKGPLPVDEALQVCRQIAEGVEAAHEKGVLHRDLKPANIKINPEGKVKILDFGLAKAFQGETPGADASKSPTLTDQMTRPGVILGTAAYMSPEQAKGKSVDKRNDIWAFGCVLYECLTGKRAFEGEMVTETLAAILKGEPDWKALLHNMPQSILILLQRCLQKEPKERLHDIADARIEIQAVLSGVDSGIPNTGSTVTRTRRLALPWIMTSVLAFVAASSVLWIWHNPGQPTLQTMRFDGTLPPGLALATNSGPAVAISPDGTRLVFAAVKDGVTQLYQRRINSFDTIPIQKTEGARAPFVSPDSRWIGFFADGSLKKVSLDGGAPLPLCKASGMGGSFIQANTILFNLQGGFSGLWSVSAGGGERNQITAPAGGTGTIFQGWPAALPGEKAVLFTSYNTATRVSVGVLSLDTHVTKNLVDGASARYVPTGHLIYARTAEGDIMAVPFDTVKWEMKGQANTVLTGVMMGNNGDAQYALSDNGTLVYVLGSGVTNTDELVLVNKSGFVELLPITPGYLMSPRISPDGNQIVFCRYGTSNAEMWVYELGRRMLRRLTDDRGGDWTPIWTPDGMRVVFQSTRSGAHFNLFWMSADGGGAIERLTTTEASNQQPQSWSLDRKRLMFQESEGLNGSFDILCLPMDGDRKPRSLLKTEHNEFHPTISPDGNWMAYVSDKSGRNEVYVQPYPDAGGIIQVSKDGGTAPVWAPDSRELKIYYQDLTGESLFSVPIRTTPKLGVGESTIVLRGSYKQSGKYYKNYDVAPDGQRFVMIRRNTPRLPNEYKVIMNWFEELKRLVPTGKK